MNAKKRTDKPYDFSFLSLYRGLILFFLPLFSYFLGIIPIVISFFYVYSKLMFYFQGLLFYVFISISLLFAFLFFIILESYIPVLFVRIFNIKTDPGEHQISIKDKNFFKHMLFYALYRPSLKIISILPLVPLRSKLVSLAGLSIGKTSLLSGSELIDEPYAVEIGEHTLIGGLTTIFGHISDTTLRLKKVKIGNNCFIGNKSVIFPGAIIEDDVYVEPGCVIAEDQVLKKGKRYQGNPASIVNE